MNAITGGRIADAGARGAVGMALGLLIASALVLGPAPARAELRRVEAVGIYGIKESMRTKVIPRDEAIAKARWEAVSRVALELIDENAPTARLDDMTLGNDLGHDLEESLSGGGEGITAPLESEGSLSDDSADVRLDHRGATEGETQLLESALGRDMLPFTRSYRILEDQGEKPVLFDDVPGIETEYVVVVEVIVDVGRVEDALVEAGLISLSDSTGVAGEALTIEVLGLSRFEALERTIEAFRGSLGASRVATLEFERGRQVLSVEGPFDLESLVRWLSGFRDAQLVLEPVAMDPESGRVRVMARWFPASDESVGGPQGRAGASGASPNS